MRLLIVLLVISVSFGAGCGRLDKFKVRDQTQTLKRDVKRYGDALRWARYRDAASFHRSRDGESASVDLIALEHYRVTGFEVLDIEMSPSLNADDQPIANTIAEVAYYLTRQGTLRSFKLHQTWWYKEDINRWFIKTPFPDFKE